MPTELIVTLYLESWQKRMLKDFSQLKRIEAITKVAITWRPGGCPGSYRISPDGMRKGDWLLYLTDQQMLQVKEHLKLRTAIPSVNITPDAMESRAVVFS